MSLALKNLAVLAIIMMTMRIVLISDEKEDDVIVSSSGNLTGDEPIIEGEITLI
jgi:hypothetical protein